jgi:hypothetical protein
MFSRGLVPLGGTKQFPTPRMLNMLSVSAKKRPIAVSAIAFGPHPFQIDAGANAMTLSHAKPPHPIPLIVLTQC